MKTELIHHFVDVNKMIRATKSAQPQSNPDHFADAGKMVGAGPQRYRVIVGKGALPIGFSDFSLISTKFPVRARFPLTPRKTFNTICAALRPQRCCEPPMRRQAAWKRAASLLG